MTEFASGDSMKIEWPKPEDTPAKLTLPPDAIILPLRKGDYGLAGFYRYEGRDVKSSRIFLISLSRHDKGPFAEIRMDLPRKPSRIVRIGDEIDIPRRPLVVRNMVPYDRERRIIGWLELAPAPKKDSKAQ